MQLSSVFVLQIPAVEAPELSAISLEELLSDDEESAGFTLDELSFVEDDDSSGLTLDELSFIEDDDSSGLTLDELTFVEDDDTSGLTLDELTFVEDDDASGFALDELSFVEDDDSFGFTLDEDSFRKDEDMLISISGPIGFLFDFSSPHEIRNTTQINAINIFFIMYPIHFLLYN